MGRRRGRRHDQRQLQVECFFFLFFLIARKKETRRKNRSHHTPLLLFCLSLSTFFLNNRGTKRVTEAVLPLMVDGGRVVNVCSRSGQMERLFPGATAAIASAAASGGTPRSPRSPRQQQTLASDGCEVLAKKWRAAAEGGDVAAIDVLCSEFVAAVREGTAGVAGWPRSMYGVSKLAQVRVGFFCCC